jgi:hypothetical protein
MGCLMFAADLFHSPYADLFQRLSSSSPSQSPLQSSSSSTLAGVISLWKEAELQFRTYFYRQMGLPSQSPILTR